MTCWKPNMSEDGNLEHQQIRSPAAELVLSCIIRSRLHFKLEHYKKRPPITPTTAPTTPSLETTKLASPAPVDGAAETDCVRLASLADRLFVPTIRVTLAVVALDALPDIALALALALKLALALGVAVAVAGAAPSLSPPAVTVTGRVMMSSSSYVVVLLPGKFASLPAADSVHVTVAPRAQSAVPVKAFASLTPISKW